MNRRQQPAPPRPPPQQQRQSAQRSAAPPQQQRQQPPPQQQQQYNPNVQRQIPAQVSIPQAISILVARINQLEDKCGAEPLTNMTDTSSEQMEEMTKRIVKLELELVTAKDIILKLQAFAINNATTAKQIVEVAGNM
jgi:hypothetical protein